MKIAIVKDFLPVMRGAEKVLEAWAEIWPGADVFSLFHNKGALSPKLEAMRIHTSFLQQFPGIRTRYPYYLPFMPHAVESFPLDDYDVVLSMSQCVAKGAVTRAHHVCYCLTPMRYVWDMVDHYFGTGLKRSLAAPMISYLRRWDLATVERVNDWIAISGKCATGSEQGTTVRRRSFFHRPTTNSIRVPERNGKTGTSTRAPSFPTSGPTSP